MRGVLLIILIALPVVVSAQTRLTIATEYPQTAMPGEGIALFARLVNERTAGRLLLTPSFDASAGVKSAQMVSAVNSRQVDMGDSYLPSLSAVNPLFSLSALPFVVSSIVEAKQLTDSTRKAYENAFSRVGLKLLYTTPWPASGVWSSQALGNADDIAALKIRTYDTTSQRTMASVAASAVNVSFADVMPMLKTGQVNAVLSSGDGGAGRKLWEFLPHFTEINYAMPVSATVINQTLFDSFDADLQSVVIAAAAQTENALWSLIQTRLQQNYATMRSNGVRINEQRDPLLVGIFAKGAQSALEDWKTAVTPDNSKLLTDFQKK
jgi:TRAP-type transport system periplasmic protein